MSAAQTKRTIPSEPGDSATPDPREDALRAGVRGEPPLTGRLEAWMIDLLTDPDACQALAAEHGSPVNVLDAEPLLRNAAELIEAGRTRGVEVGVFLARKANKALGLVEAAVAAGHGVDVASLAELRQVLEAGVTGERVLLTAAVKPDALLAEAVDAGAIVSVDSLAELARVAAIAAGRGASARVMPRLAPTPGESIRPTRFGERAAVWVEQAASWPVGVAAVGVHAHLDGYAAGNRVLALGECLQIVDALVAAGQPVEFVDLGGGVPMSYLDSAEEWDAFWRAYEDADGESLTWLDKPLAKVYPYHQTPVRGGWLEGLLDSPVSVGARGGHGDSQEAATASAMAESVAPAEGAATGSAAEDEASSRDDASGATETAAEALRRRGLRLHLEPGRSLLDGCGLTLARVAFLKERSDGVPLVGLEMNRTQCRSTSDDFLVDPVLVRMNPDAAGAGDVPHDPADQHVAGVPVQPTDQPADDDFMSPMDWRATSGDGAGGTASDLSAFLVGAYCIEDELILLRRMHFPGGVAPGDLIALVNTGGYLMHILESASHQIPLARNVIRTPDGFALDAIDR